MTRTNMLGSRTLLWPSCLFALILLALPLDTAAAQAEGEIRILVAGPISLDQTGGTAEVLVANNSSETRAISLRAVADEDALQKIVVRLRGDETTDTQAGTLVGPGSVQEFEVVYSGRSSAKGFQLFATSDGAGGDDASIVIEQTTGDNTTVSTALPDEMRGRIVRPLPVAVANAWNRFSAEGAQWDPSMSTTIELPTFPPSVDPRTVGVIVEPNGDSATVRHVETQLEVTSLDVPGTYRGAVDLSPGIDGGEAKVIVDAKDTALWALLVLVLGLFAAVKIDESRRAAPLRAQVLRRINDIRQRAHLAKKDAQEKIRSAEDSDSVTLTVPSIFSDDFGADLLLDREVRRVSDGLNSALREYVDPSNLESEVEKLTAALDAAEGRTAEYGLAADRLANVAKSLRDLRSTGKSLDECALPSGVSWPRIAEYRVVRDTISRLSADYSEGIRNEQELAQWVKNFDYHGPRVTLLRKSLARLLSLAQAMTSAEKVNLGKVHGLAVHLSRAEDKADIDAVDKDLEKLIEVRTHGGSLDVRSREELPDEARAAGTGIRGPSFRGGAAARLTWKDLGISLSNYSSADRTSWWWRLAAAILVISSGITVLYFGNDSFGSLGDYLGVLVWGTAVGQGLEALRRFAASGPA
jgi:hypothetical protein